MDALWYGHKYGLVDDAIFDKLWNQCDIRFPSLLALGGPEKVASELNKELLALRITGASKEQVFQRRREAAKVLLERKMFPDIPSDDPSCKVAYRKFILSSSNALSQGWKDMFIDDYSLFAPITNKENIDMATYMRRADVRKALHVEDAPVMSWPSSGVGFEYVKEYDACNWGEVTDSRSMIDFYRDIAPRLMVTWVYNGDTDPCLSYEGTSVAIKRVGFSELDGGGYRPWFYTQDGVDLSILAEKAPLFGPNLLAQDVGVQMGGEIVNYENNLSFLTFHGSGHMVPQFRPQAALHMVNRLVSFRPLSPMLPLNATLEDLSEAEFVSEMNDWTEAAKASPYVDTVVERRNVPEAHDTTQNYIATQTME